MRGETLLQHAIQALKERRAEYGGSERLFSLIARRWTLVLGYEITPQDVVMCMVEVKMARLTVDPAHFDSIIDVAGYSAVLAELIPERGASHVQE